MDQSCRLDYDDNVNEDDMAYNDTNYTLSK